MPEPERLVWSAARVLADAFAPHDLAAASEKFGLRQFQALPLLTMTVLIVAFGAEVGWLCRC